MPTLTLDRAPDDFRALALRVRDAGLLDRRPGYYGVKIGLTIAAYAVGWAALVVIGDSWATLGVAAYLGVVFTQLGFIGHDAGHQQVFRSRRANGLLGLVVGNALIGLSFGWWVTKHNAHHANPNQVGRDPDIAGGLTVVPTGNGGAGDHRRFAKWMVRRQARLFFPLNEVVLVEASTEPLRNVASEGRHQRIGSHELPQVVHFPEGDIGRARKGRGEPAVTSVVDD